ncbi:PilX N-terminal domain-containing pilus assembly protein [Roseateles sp.]|uniref:PilX N-terminal domain-containing pilus assembly protein n=1 Tax=Roseateles sp. TaxID=1971397 RepID=UPI002E03176E|nr:PilX N-terminal domain-containing pilus assembly protein [Roseateles sp.]
MSALNVPKARPQRGAATLVVVMVLFLVMALLAAYGNRSLLFEQRIASSYLRASLSQEAAEAGIEWTLAQLNGAGIDANCKPVSSGGQRFADRYLNIDPADRTITSRTAVSAYLLDCARDLTQDGWACRCPAADAAATPATALPAGAELPSSFSVDFAKGPRNGTLQLLVLGCTDSVIDNCKNSDTSAVSQAQLGRTRLKTTIALVSAVRSPPASPLVVKGSISSSGAGLGLHNTDPRSNGLLVAMGGSTAWPGRVDDRLESVPGTSLDQVVGQDARLADVNTTTDDLFRMYLGATVQRYPSLPALRKLACSGDCSADIQAAYDAGQRVLWVNGPLTISSNPTLASITDPLLLIATGDVTLTGGLQLNGMLVTPGNLTWTNGTALPSLINGMVLVGGNVQTGGAVDIVYQQTVADELRNRTGGFVRVPGSWNTFVR